MKKKHGLISVGVATTSLIIFIVIMWSRSQQTTSVCSPETASCNSKHLAISPSQNASMLTRLAEFPGLESLELNCFESLTQLPDSVYQLSHLRKLIIDNGNGCKMDLRLSANINELRDLQTLILANAIKDQRSLPAAMDKLVNLKQLTISGASLKKIPSFIFKLRDLNELDLSWNRLDKLPNGLTKLIHLKTINLSNNFKITCSAEKEKILRKRFPNFKFVLGNDYDCPER